MAVIMLAAVTGSALALHGLALRRVQQAQPA
jgi:hypothetical protein